MTTGEELMEETKRNVLDQFAGGSIQGVDMTVKIRGIKSRH